MMSANLFSCSWKAGTNPLMTLLLLLMALTCLAPVSVVADEEKVVSAIQVPNPAADLWREVRQRDMVSGGITQAGGVDSATLINPYGEKWRLFRMEQLIPYGGYALIGVILLLVIFYFVRGRIPMEHEVSDKKLFRYTVYERTIHWFMASIFLFLAFTGLILLFGRSLLLPIMGPDIFSLLASASKEAHNLFGPLFLFALLLMFVQFVRRNIYQKGDLTWLLKGGGIVGKTHLPSNFFNMGEKSMFWMLILVGAVIVVSGFVLLFPMFGQARAIMELSHVAHGIATLAMTAVIIGHIYIGTLGMEGAIDSMKTGYCDLNWAREHHSNWAELCEQQGEILSEDQVAHSQRAHQSTRVRPEAASQEST